MPAKRVIQTDIIGTSHLNLDGTDREDLLRECNVGDQLELVHDPDNRFSRTAIRVLRCDGGQLGYTPDAVGAEIASRITRGGRLKAQLVGFKGNDSGSTSLGATIAIEFHDDAGTSIDIRPADTAASTGSAAAPEDSAAVLGREYQAMVEAALYDGLIDKDEAFQMRVFSSGMSEELKRTVHARILAKVLADALQDGVLTDAECTRITWVCQVLQRLGWVP